MKKLLFSFLFLLTTTVALAQAPQRISYQSIIRDGNNVVVASTTVGIKISVIRGTATGTAVYVETHRKSTNANGLLSLEIGDGTAISGTFAGIDWSNGPFLIKTETDPTGGTNYSIPGIAALNSVPYALFSANGTPGPQGERGATGAIGLTGATGPVGANGTNGAAGATGPQGPIGLTGPTGAAGAQGPIGLTGPTGSVGATGAGGTNGTNGAAGATGPQGPIGLTGVGGTNGAAGATGPQGPIGLTGVGGTNGTAGATGPQGPIGLTGATGPIGPAGADGATGTTGPQGIKGDTGATGPQGAKGDTGATGAPGPQGIQGLAGANNGITYTVTNSGSGAYLINGGSNPPLTVIRGMTYIFQINASGHPFWLQTASGAYNASNTYAAGVTNNGAAVGTITWQVPFDAPNTLYYICQFHSAMNGQISVTNAGPVGPQGIQGVAGAAGTQGIQGLTGATGPAPSGTGIVTVSGGTLQTPGSLTGDVTTTGAGLATTIATDAVTSNKILDGTIATADLANSAVTDDKIAGVAGSKVSGNITGNAATATLAQTVTTNANLAGPITSVGNVTSIAAQTGTGTTFVMSNSPTLVTPALGTPASGIATNLTGLPLSTGVTGTLPVANGGTGATTLTGLVKGNGTDAMTAAVAGTDYQAPLVLTTTTGSGAATLTGAVLNIPTIASGTAAGDMLYWSGSAWVKVAAGSTGQILSLVGTIPVWQKPAIPSMGSTDVYNHITGKVWMDRNLGASQVASSSGDHLAYGSLYQWGRRSDGHELITWTNGTTGASVNTTSSIRTDTPGNQFITISSSPFDWRSSQNDNLWQGVNGVNNPCPTGYRIPTETEINAERLSWSSNTSAGAFASPLKLPMAGYRRISVDQLLDVGTRGLYWSSTVISTRASSLSFSSSTAGMFDDYRGFGYSVRCIKD